MKEGLWIVLALVALCDRRARPMTFLLLFLWLYSYAFVFFSWFDPTGYQASLWLTFAALALACFLLRADGRNWATLSVTVLLALSLAVQMLFWSLPMLWTPFSTKLYWFGVGVFTTQLGVMAVFAVLNRIDLRHRRRRQKEALSR